MIKLKKKFDYQKIFSHLLLFIIFILFNRLDGETNVYSIAVLSSSISLGCNLIISPLLFLASFLVFGETGYLLSAVFPAVFLPIIRLIYKKYSVSPKYETVLYTAISLTLYLVIGNTNYLVTIEKRIISAILTILFSFFCFSTGKTIKEKGLKYKFGYEETLSIYAVMVILGLGVCNLISPNVYKILAIFLILLTAYMYKKGICVLTSAVLGIVYAIYFSNLSFISLFLLFGIFAENVMPFNRYVSSIILIAVDYFSFQVFGVYPAYELLDFIFSSIGVLLFIALPDKPLEKLKDVLYSYRERQLVRQTINRNRIMTSNRLYELSTVFSEMASAYTAFQKEKLPEETLKLKMQSDVINSVCKKCDFYSHCHAIEQSKDNDVFTLIDIGVAKGKLTLIDMPKNLNRKCMKPSTILFSLNKTLTEYKTYLDENGSVNEGRLLIASEAQGVSEILKGLALETGTLLKYHSRLERLISKTLLRSGIRVSELLIYGEDNNLSICLMVTMKELPIEQITRILTSVTNIDLGLKDKTQIAEDKYYLVFRKNAEYDAVFGISRHVKDNSTASGDTYSVTRLSSDKFLLALSDGMGSGENAKKISTVSLSLIESFYKAGLNSNLILNTVNRLLAVNAEDRFTALDISVINLNDLTADFIKYGAPFCYIINDSGIKIVESNSLPLGILKEIKPSVCTTTLCENDVILFVSDGISDAFTSSSDMVDYLRTLPALNPQSLTDQIINKAVNLNDGEKKDDMTALAVRIFRRVS